MLLDTLSELLQIKSYSLLCNLEKYVLKNINRINDVNDLLGFARNNIVSKLYSLKGVKPTKYESLASILYECILTDKPFKQMDYIEFYNKKYQNLSASGIIDELSQYTTVSPETLRKSFNNKQLNGFKDKTYCNVVDPISIKGVTLGDDLTKITLGKLLKNEGRPTRTQKQLFTYLRAIADKPFSEFNHEELRQASELILVRDKVVYDKIKSLGKLDIEILDANNYLNLITGDLMNCCMNLGTKVIRVYTTNNTFNQILIKDNEKNKYIANAVIWRNVFDYLVIDNIEATSMSQVDTFSCKELFIALSSEIVKTEGLKGAVQGIGNNDKKLYPEEFGAKTNLCAAYNKNLNLVLQDFYTDAEYVCDKFIESEITDFQNSMEFPNICQVK